MILVCLFGLFLVFRLISETSEEYLSIALNRLSIKFHFSEALTGVTLLALANGSPDIISSGVAGGQYVYCEWDTLLNLRPVSLKSVKLLPMLSSL